MPALAMVLLATSWPDSRVVRAQRMPRPLDLSDTIYLDQADSAARTHLEQIKRFLADRHWEEALESLLKVADEHGNQMVQISPTRYASVRQYCQSQIARFAPEGLALYRARIDAQAQRWYDQGIASRDPEKLERVVEAVFCSSWGDDALWALGEIELEQGRYAAARSHWQRILPSPASDREGDARLNYPDTDLAAAEVHARLVLVSILEGSSERAEKELAEFRAAYPDASGRLVGREGNLASRLSAVWEESRTWPPTPLETASTTFAASPTRNEVLPSAFDIGPPAWAEKVKLPDTPASSRSVAVQFGCRPTRVAEDHGKPLSYHPLVKDDLILLATANEVWALDLHSGKPAWGRSSAVIHAGGDERKIRRSGANGTLGAARFTLTRHGDRLYARLGSPVTATQSIGRWRTPQRSRIVCLDLSAQGRLVWEITPPDDRWAFDGTPVTDGKNIYVAMRVNELGPQPQAYVACYDAGTGRAVWHTFVCRAETLGHGYVNEITHNLLTLEHETIYINTNLGAVAALSARDGHLKWITLYPRAEQGADLNAMAAHFYRDLNPCLYDQGRLFVAPADCREILALEADSGRLLWKTQYAEDVVHLLGVRGQSLIVSGDLLSWIDVRSGKILSWWPDGTSPKGYGRGVLAGDRVYWPTRTMIRIFDSVPRPTKQQQPLSEFRLADQYNATGGNLLVADDYLLIATGDSLTAFRRFPRRGGPATDEVARDAAVAVRPPSGGFDRNTGTFRRTKRVQVTDGAGRTVPDAPGVLRRAERSAPAAAETLVTHSREPNS